MSMKLKFAFIYIVMVFCILTVGIVSTVSFYSISEDIDSMIETNYRNIQSVDEMLEIIDRQDSATLMYMTIGKNDGIAVFTEGMQNFLNWFYLLEANNPEMQKIRSNYDIYCKNFSFLQEEVAKNGLNAGVDYYNHSLSPLFQSLKEDIRAIRDTNINEMLSRKKQATENARMQSVFIFLLTLCVALGAYFFATILVRRMLSPLTVLSNHLKKVSNGDFTQPLHMNRSDEIGVIADEFNHMLTRLQEYETINVSNLLAEKKNLETLTNNIENPFLIVDFQFMIELLNPAAERFFETNAKSAEKRHIIEIIQNKEILELLKTLSLTEEERREKVVFFPVKEKTYHVIATKITDQKKYSLLMQDVTTIKETEKIRTDFIATVSHELKTPLTSILMGSSILSNSGLEKGQQEIIDTVKDDVSRLSKLIDELLELSKIQSGNITYHLCPESVFEIANHSISQFSEVSKYHKVTIINEISKELPPVKADFEKLTLVFNNILNNAFKYTDEGDLIRLNAIEEENFIKISIQDTGLGISEENLKQLFQSDFRHSDDNIEYRGSGLGLYLSGQIINAHHGTIRAVSQPGKGSTFVFTIPTFKEETNT